MNRREWMIATAALGAATMLPGIRNATPDNGRIVVDGLDTSILNEEFLELLRKGGVHCSHHSVESVVGYGSMHSFLDAHPDKMVLATSVADIEAAKAAGKIHPKDTVTGG